MIALYNYDNFQCLYTFQILGRSVQRVRCASNAGPRMVCQSALDGTSTNAGGSGPKSHQQGWNEPSWIFPGISLQLLLESSPKCFKNLRRRFWKWAILLLCARTGSFRWFDVQRWRGGTRRGLHETCHLTDCIRTWIYPFKRSSSSRSQGKTTFSARSTLQKWPVLFNVYVIDG